jgi:hypothetical protein
MTRTDVSRCGHFLACATDPLAGVCADFASHSQRTRWFKKQASYVPLCDAGKRSTRRGRHLHRVATGGCLRADPNIRKF